MQLIKLRVKGTRLLYGVATSSLYTAMFAAIHPKKIYTLNRESSKRFLLSKLEEYRKVFGCKTLRVLKDVHMELLKKYKVTVVKDIKELNLDGSPRQIFHDGKTWFAVLPQSGGAGEHLNEITTPPSTPKRTSPKKTEDIAASPKSKELDLPKSNKTLQAPRTPTKISRPIVRRIQQGERSIFSPVAPNEFALTPEEFKLLIDNSTDVLTRTVIQDIVLNLINTKKRKPATMETSILKDITNYEQRDSKRTRMSGGYYHKNKTRPNGRTSSSKETICFPSSKDYEFENIFHSILAFSDTHHDFGSYIQKTDLHDVYMSNNHYNHDMNTLQKRLKNATLNYLTRRGFNENERLSEENRVILYLSRLNNLNNIRDNVYYDLINVVPPNSEKEVYLDPQNSPTKTAGGWEAQFLSKFFYLLFPLEEREKIYKVNVAGNKTWGVDLHKFLLKQNFKYYFFDMTLAAAELRESTQFKYTTLKNSVESGRQEPTKHLTTPKQISQLDTIAKWWDPSTGGDLIPDDIGKFSDILKEQVIQDCNNVRFQRITNVKPISAPGSPPFVIIQLTYNTVFEDPLVMYDEESPLYVELSVQERPNKTTACYITVPKTGFNITACTAIYQYIENWIEMPKSRLKEFLEKHEADLKMVVLSLKRSGDHGQVMYLRHHNKEKGAQERAFLITGDNLCVTKAIYEKQPVLFAKHSLLNKQKHFDLYFYNPNSVNKSREIYIRTNLMRYFESESWKLDSDEPKRFLITIKNGKFSITVQFVDQDPTFKMIEEDMRSLLLCHKFEDIRNYDILSKGAPLKTAFDYFMDASRNPLRLSFEFPQVLREDILTEMENNRLNDPVQNLYFGTERTREIKKRKEIEAILKDREKARVEKLFTNLKLLNVAIETVGYHIDNLIEYCKLNIDYLQVLSKASLDNKDQIIKSLRNNFVSLFTKYGPNLAAMKSVYQNINSIVEESYNIQNKVMGKLQELSLKFDELYTLVYMFSENSNLIPRIAISKKMFLK